ncbi:TetR/AcrR family transcriptional regulator [Corynebacterium sp. P7202]|uniref:TetR family transcriptional regulator n=1 Tax=Corynebacterium pygosceleis TaxID=2800406 RepID=A0A9Q4GK26_9CORY|nr:TetR family transcriptional regulator [Corynebacterium pygosceleis]MCK7638038.1 TetR/AcrR family transcriptional regulator [Corynebacterium pygosceleis]MCX7468754.1 TetR family transcriptional regulator [Corynebacterium pygosceleis]
MKRLATRAAIDDHATQLVLEHGFDSVTVEDICTAAGISRRTFFNYVDSKETAVIGEHPRPLTTEEIEEFTAERHPDLNLAVMRCAFRMSNLFSPCADGRTPPGTISTGELLRRRRRICRAEPQLSLQRTARYPDIHASLIGAVTSYLDAWPDERRLSPSSPREEAVTVVAVATTAVRLGFHLWMEGNEPTADALRSSCVRALNNITLLLTKGDEKA